MTRRLVVTGATGFIGRRLVSAAADAGWTVRALVRRPAEAELDSRAEVMRWQLEGAGARPEVFGDGAVVAHLAAMIPADYADPGAAQACFQVNALGTLEVLRAAEAVEGAHLIHVSSGNCYAPRAGLVTEDAPLFPSPRAPWYLTSKATAEVWVEHFRLAGRLGSAVLRVSSVYGPGMVAGGLIPIFASRLLAGQPVQVHDGGRYTVDLVHVDDVVAAILAAADRRACGIYNVGAGRLTTTLEVAQAMTAVCDAAPSLVTVDPPSDAPAALGFAGLDVSRARADLGYAPRSLRDGLTSYVRSLS